MEFFVQRTIEITIIIVIILNDGIININTDNIPNNPIHYDKNKKNNNDDNYCKVSLIIPII